MSRLQSVGCLVFALVGILEATRSAAQESPGWEVMRVYVPPESQVGSVLSPNYDLVQAKQFESLLREASLRRQRSLGKSAGIREAFYLCRLDGDEISSKHSLWKLLPNVDQVPIELGSISVALRASELTGPASQAALNSFRHLSDGRTLLAPDEPLEEIWFGFSTKSTSSDMRRSRFQFTLPPAVVGTYFLSVPNSLELDGPDVPWTKIADPRPTLPAGWPSDDQLFDEPNRTWYQLSVSARSQFEFSIQPSSQPNELRYDLHVASSESEYSVTRSGIKLDSEFRLYAIPAGGKLLLRADEEVCIRSVRVNGQVSEFREIHDTGSEHRRIAVQLPLNATDLLIQVESFAAVPFPYHGSLPTLSVFRGYILNGKAALNVADELEIEDLRVADSIAVMTVVPTAAGAREQPQWRWSWQGVASRALVTIGLPASQWEVRTLTKIAVHSAWISADCHLRLVAHKPGSNQVTLNIGNGWFVDSVVSNGESSPVTFELTARAGGGNGLTLHWDAADQNMEIDLNVAAHNPSKTDSDIIRLPASQLINLPGSDQDDAYIVDASGQFQPQISPELLQLRQSEADLLHWQRAWLPRMTDAWIFRGIDGRVPPLMMRRMRGNYTARHTTTIHPTVDGTRILHHISCQPVSGSIGRVIISMPVAAEGSLSAWSLVRPAADAPLVGSPVTSSIVSSTSAETLYEVVLPSAVTHAFALEAELNFPESAERITVPLPSVPQSVGQEGLIVMPEDFDFVDDLSGLEILPARECCSENELARDFSQQLDRLVACRYDPSELSSIELRTRATENRVAWCWQQSSNHWQSSSGKAWHETAWLFMVPEAQSVAISIPHHWTIRSLAVERKHVEIPASLSSKRFLVELPAGNAIAVRLACHSERDRTGWLDRLFFAEPILNVQVLSREQRTWISPAKISVASLFVSSEQDGLMKRLQPKSWWRWMLPDPWNLDNANGQPVQAALNPPLPLESNLPTDASASSHKPNFEDLNVHAGGWTLVPSAATLPRCTFISPDTKAAIDEFLTCWIVDRSAMGAFALAVVLVVTLGLHAILGTSLFKWWTLLIFTTIATIAVPEWLLPFAQLFFLALVTAGVARLVRTIVKIPASASRAASTRRGSTVSLRHASRFLWILCFLSWSSSASAQVSTEPQKLPRPEIFSVLVPIQDDGQLSGDYVYVPNRLHRMLENSKQQLASSSSARIEAVLYALQISSASLERSTVSDFTLELAIEVVSEDKTFRFPLLSSEVQLLRGFVNGQELFVGGSLRQEAGYIVWRAPDIGRYKLRLNLLPKAIRESDSRAQLAIHIPRLAISHLEIRAESTKEIEVAAIGKVRRDSSTSLAANLGPTDELNVNWPLRFPRQPLHGVPQVFADSWIHIQHQHVSALCQLRITGANSLDRLVHAECDSSWEPVGNDWKDAVVLSSSIIPGTSKRSYELMRTTLGNDSAVIRVLMLPKATEGHSPISIPSLSLRESPALTRTLAYSVLERPGWMLAGTEKWQPLPDIGQAVAYWSGAQLSEQPTMLRVPLGTISAALIPQPVSSLPTVDEQTSVYLRLPESTLEYAARWQPSPENPSAIRLRIPVGYRVISVRVNEHPIRHSLIQDTQYNRLIAFQDTARGGLQVIKVELKFPSHLERAMLLPRVVLEDAAVATSSYRLIRSAELACTLEPVEGGGLDLKAFQDRARPLFPDLDYLVGETKLAANVQQSVALPLSTVLRRAKTTVRASSVLKMIRQESGWLAQLECEIDTPDRGLDTFLIDIPVEMRDRYKTTTPSMTLPSAETGRVTLCIVPPAPTNGKTRITVAATQPSTGASQSILIPDMRLISANSPRPALALPNEVDRENIRWNKIGRSLANIRELQWFDAKGYSLFEYSSDQRQISWRAIGQPTSKPRVLLCRSSVAAQQDQSCSGSLEFWIEPRNQNYLNLTMPEDCELLGVMLGDDVANWHRLDGHQIQILMQPSYLPIRMRLLVRWDLKTDREMTAASEFGLAFPLLDAVREAPHLIEFRALSGAHFAHPAQSKEIALSAALDATCNTWRAMLNSSFPMAANRPPAELAGWLAHWNPRMMGIDSVAPARVSATAVDADPSVFASPGSDGADNWTLSDFWQAYVNRLGASREESEFEPTPTRNAVQASHANYARDTWPLDPKLDDLKHLTASAPLTTDQELVAAQKALRRQHWFEYHDSRKDANELVLKIAHRPSAPVGYNAWVLASLLMLLGLFGALCGNRWGPAFAHFIEVNPWLLWCGLASAALWWLPVLWPGCVLAVCAVYVSFQCLFHRPLRSRQF